MNKINSTNKIIELTAYSGIKLQKSSGEMPCGVNGPWKDSQTPVRNTAHWSLVFLEAYKCTNDKVLYTALRKAVDYLCSIEARPMGSTFFCRYNPNKDFCNGLVGQAWVIKALLLVGEYLQEEKYIKVAIDVYNAHNFDQELGLWETRNVDGSKGTLCKTFNQQLWFAVISAIAYKLTSNKEILNKLNGFYEKIDQNMSIVNNGRINHLINSRKRSVSSFITSRIKEDHNRSVELEIGYHSFNLYGFALLYKYFPEHEFWRSSKTKNLILKILTYIKTKEYKDSLRTNKYAPSYNPAGIEIGCALSVFREYIDTNSICSVDEWLNFQLENHYDITTNLMNKNTKDGDTLSARIYQLMDLPDLNISFK